MKGERAALSLLAIAFLAIHLQLFLFPNGFFAFLHADEIDVLMARAEVRAGQPLVLTHPAGKPDEGGAAALAYLLAPLPLDDPRAATAVLRGTAIALAGATLALWTRFWRRALGGTAGLVPALLWLFPQEGWISVTIQLQAPYAVSALAAALAANLALPFLSEGERAPAGQLAALGGALGALTILCPGAAPACVGAAAVVALARGPLAERVRGAALLFVAACAAVAPIVALEWWARGESPLPMLAGWAMRSGGDAAGAWYERPPLALTNLFAPGRVWMMGWALFDTLVVLAVMRRWLARDGGPLARRAMAIHECAALLTVASHLFTRFAASASYSIVPVLPHLVGLAGAAVAGALGGAAPGASRTPRLPWRPVAVAFVAWWVGSGLLAAEERFARRDIDLAYPGIAVAKLVAPRLAERSIAPTAPIASTMHWALPLAIHRRDAPSCCIPRSICEVGCEPGFFHGGPGTFVLPGPAAHPHGEPEALALAPRLVDAARDDAASPLAIECAGADGVWRSVTTIPPDAIAVIAEAPDGDRALAALLGR